MYGFIYATGPTTGHIILRGDGDPGEGARADIQHVYTDQRPARQLVAPARAPH